jgi:hypothetical protein
MLLVWLFALTSGIVNACLIEPAAHQAAHAAGPAADAQTQAAASEHAAAMAGHQHHQPPPASDKAPCAKFCADGSTSTPVGKPQIDPLGGAWLAPLPTRSLAVQAALAPADAFDTVVPVSILRVPIPIVFLRLTL